MLLTPETAVVSPDRTPNEVDELLARVKETQAACGHDFRLVRAIELKPLCDPEVFATPSGVAVICLRCSLDKYLQVYDRDNLNIQDGVCPCCLSSIHWAIILSYEERDALFPEHHRWRVGYYRILVTTCRNCGIKLACGQWNQ